MRKLIALLAFVLLPLGTAQAQFCPGAAPYVFTDVLANDTFCGFITRMAVEGITTGCQIIDANNRRYCPDDFVTRKQMSAFMIRLADAQFPLSCVPGQVMKWNGLDWACADDNIGGSGGGGTVTSVAAGTGLAATPNPIVGAGVINLAPGYQLPQGCGNGQVAKSNGSNVWTCQNDNDTNAGGTVTSVTAGTGLTGGTITSAGTIAIAAGGVTAAMLAQSGCTNGQVLKWNGSAWACAADAAGPANAFVQGGNAFGAVAVLGTTEDQSLDIRVNSGRVMRYEPNAISPNVIGGSPANNVTAGVRGATIAGGGVPAGSTDPDFSSEAPNRVTDHYGTVGGGYANRAGDDVGTTLDSAFATVGGGMRNIANGPYSAAGGGQNNTAGGNYGTVGGGRFNSASGASSTVGGGSGNTASGSYSTVSGGFNNIASGDYSWAGGRAANTQTPGFSPTIHHGTFVWADNSSSHLFYSSANNEFAARAGGGVRFVTAIDGTGAATRYVRINPNGELEFGSNERQNINLWSNEYGIGVQAFTQYFRTAGGYSWHRGGTHSNSANDPGAGGTELMRLQSNGNLLVLGTLGSLSDRAAKRDFAPIDTAELLEKVVRLPLAEWSYERSPEARHVGPTAQDFRAAFGLGDSERSIAAVDADGVALAAIQGLNAKVEAQAREIAELKAQVERLLAAR